MSTYYYRRGSIFWALTLIAVGVLFLYQNFNPEVHPWRVVAKYWPVLIIFWGISKLIDYFRGLRHPDEAPPSLFSGGEVVLLILILIFGTLISKVVLHPWQQWSSDFGINHDEFADLFLNSYSYTKTLSLPAKPGDRLLIVNRRGDVEIHGSDQQTLDATIKETVRADSEDAAKKIAQDLKVNLVEQDGQYVFKSNLDSLPHNGVNVRLDITFHLPRATSSQITAERGDLIAESLKGDQTLTDKHGDVHAKNIQGLVRITKEEGSTEIQGVNGSVEVDGRGGDVSVSDVTGTLTVSGDFSGAVQFHNVAQLVRYSSSRTNLTAQKLSGQLRMDLGSLDASGIGGPLEVTTRQKDITVKNFLYGIKVTDVNGDVRLRPAAPPSHPIEVDLKRGSIELALPPSSAFQIDARSEHGEVESEFPGLTVTKGGDNPSITGSAGKGGPTIKLSTTYGTIRVLRGAPASALPANPSSAASSETRLSLQPSKRSRPARSAI
jgi:DUF4097 and DUF4098 domain-containing protein YvlB